LLDNRLRERLAFKPGIDWTSGLAASLRNQIEFLVGEMDRRGGVADNPIALDGDDAPLPLSPRIRLLIDDMRVSDPARLGHWRASVPRSASKPGASG
jgi:hypothetical protein